MIRAFLNRNNNIDSLILVLIGVIIPMISKGIWIFVKKVIKLAKKRVVLRYKFFKRRITGNYSLKELEAISNKPEDKRSKKEKIAVAKYEEWQEQMSDSMEQAMKSLGRINSTIDLYKNSNS